VLCGFIKSTLSNGTIKGIPLHPRIDPLSHLQIVNDTLLMGQTLVREALAFKDTL